MSRRTYEIRTYGCQMNVHDSERLAGLLEDAGYEAVADAAPHRTSSCSTPAPCARTPTTASTATSATCTRPRPPTPTCRSRSAAAWPRRTAAGSSRRRRGSTSSSAPTIWPRCRCCSNARGTTRPRRSRSSRRCRTSRPTCPRAASRRSAPGCRSRSAATTPARSASSRRLRGGETDRRPGDVLAEIRALVDAGVVEVTLLGQNVNSYGRSFGDRYAFGKLLRACGDIDGLERVRFTSPHPRDFTDDVHRGDGRDAQRHAAAAHADAVRVGRGAAGDAPLVPAGALPRHHRRGTRGDAATPRSPPTSSSASPARPRTTSSRRCEVVRQARFASAFTFQYSKRPGTPAADMAGQVPKAVVQERYERLIALQDEISWDEAKRLVGRPVEVLVNATDGRKDGATGRVSGRARDGRLVHVAGLAVPGRHRHRRGHLRRPAPPGRRRRHHGAPAVAGHRRRAPRRRGAAAAADASGRARPEPAAEPDRGQCRPGGGRAADDGAAGRSGGNDRADQAADEQRAAGRGSRTSRATA